ncbi:hypothetical protein F5148DRAFT_1197017 [Russula earlei]|uniref:Uncharacterized protein n=1 Tax=Russula earlei TaxID=71964 RepID=A0ACC0UA15_9AGAM|nr:hypothetical protein F5148DRAFT_1197017 [Russula earlei]
MYSPMSLTGQSPRFTPLDKLPISAVHRLHRRSSCPSLPRSVSVYSSTSSIDLKGSEDLGDVEIYMSPLFRGPGQIETAHSEVVGRMSTKLMEGFTPKAETSQFDDLSGRLSRYQFAIIDDEDVPEPSEPCEANLGERSLAPIFPLASSVPPNPKESQPLPPLPHSRTFKDSPLPDLPTAARPVIPSSTGTRPLQIKRSKKPQESSTISQNTSSARLQYERPSAKTITRSTTQVNLREAYKKASPLAERKVYVKEVRPTMAPSLRAHLEDRSPIATEVTNIHRLAFVDKPTARHRKPLSQHYFPPASSLLRMRETNSSMPTVWNDSRFQTNRVHARVGRSAVHPRSRKPKQAGTWSNR